MKERNIFLEHKKTILQIARANKVNISVAANMAVQMANEVLSGKEVSLSTNGVENFMTWVGEVENYTPPQLGSQMAEFNQQATEALKKGQPWTL